MEVEKVKNIFYKNTVVKKNNKYTWCGIVDCNGRMLKNTLLNETKEFYDYMYEVSQGVSDMLIDRQMYLLGVHKTMQRFFKVVDPILHAEYIRPQKRERGRLNRENLYIFSTYDDAFYNNETFTKGILWMMTSLENLQNTLPYIDNIRILRVNHDFVKLFGSDSVEMYTFDDIITDTFTEYDNLVSEISVKNKQIAELKQSPKKISKTVEEISDNGMIFIRQNELAELPKKKVGNIYDYSFVFYRRSHMEPIQIESHKKHYFNTLDSEKTLKRDKISKILR